MSTNQIRVVNKEGTEYFYDKNKYKSFKERYTTDPLYRSKHLMKSKEKVKCNKCFKMVTRSNISKHYKTNMCKKGQHKLNIHRLLMDIKNFDLKNLKKI